ncbi:MAG: secretin, partial [Marinobacter sp. 34-60-7]
MYQILPRFRSVLLTFAAIVALAASQTAFTAEARVYELSHRTADDVAFQIRELYQQAPVTISARGQQLIARGEPVLLDEIGVLVESMDVPPVQMRISIRYLQDIGGKESGGGVTVNRNGVAVNAERRTISTQSTRERSLVVQDGQSAHITSG